MSNNKLDKNNEKLFPENIKPRFLETEMQESYLAYAMSVIVARALPDVRDGLKPVHRRVLYSMHELGLRPTAKYRKSATVVGDVLGKYHPHGDVAVYDSMVRMAQPFSMRYTLVDGQGNFGSLDGDSPAAMRYTEARMAKISEEMLADIEKNTVDFIPNYDGSRTEPTVLPAKVPQLLLNGCLGIAVGMATEIPPHNLTELVNGLIYLIDHEDANTEKLCEFIEGPDFPTGGIVYGSESVKAAYGTGKGKIILRGCAEIVEQKNGRFKILISEIPYQVNKAELVAKIAELVRDKKLEGISDIRDESDRRSGVRIVIELKQNAYAKKILNKMYQLTNLQIAYHFNMLALVNGIQPKTLTLKDILVEFIKHRKVIIKRRTEFDLEKAKERAHILEGLKKALDHIDEIIKTIKQAENKEIAHQNLMKNFELSDKQSQAILEMKLSTLSGLERQKINDELKEKIELIAKLTKILGSELMIADIIKKELIEVKEKYNSARRTKIVKGGLKEFKIEDLVPNEQVIVTITKDNYIKRVPVETYRIQKRGGKGKTGISTKEEDSVLQLLVTMTHNTILFFTNKGRVFSTKVYEIPQSSRQAKGQALVNFLQLMPEEKVTVALAIDGNLSDKKYLFMITKKGVVKKTLIEKFNVVRKSGLIAIKLNGDDKLEWVFATNNNEILIATQNGQSIHFNESDVRPMGRSAAGVRGIRIKEGDQVIAASVIKSEKSYVLTVSENGYGKRTKIKEFTLQRRGGSGLRAARVTKKTGTIVGVKVVYDYDDDLIIVSSKGIVLRTNLKTVKVISRDTQGVRIIKINSDDKVASMTVFSKKLEGEIETSKTELDKKLPIETKNEKELIKPLELKSEKKEFIPKIKSQKYIAPENKATHDNLSLKHYKKIKISEGNKKENKNLKINDYRKNENPDNYWGSNNSK